MNCKFHPERNAVHRCDKCGALTCQECSIIIDGRVACKNCVNELLDGRSTYRVESAEPSVKAKPIRRKPSFIISAFLALCCPGSSHMYMGFMKRGLFLMTMFFLSIFIVSITQFGPLALFIPIIHITACFDAYNLRRRLIGGEEVADTVNDITGFIYTYRMPIIVISGIFVVFGWASRMLNIVNRYLNYPLYSRDIGFLLLSLAVIAFGVYIFKHGKKYDDTKDNNTII